MDIEQCRPTISDAEFCGKLRVWRESTSTSPSGMHLGHYKVLVARHSFSTTADDTDLTLEFIERRDELNRKQTEIRLAKLAVINYALERGYSFQYCSKIPTICDSTARESSTYTKLISTLQWASNGESQPNKRRT